MRVSCEVTTHRCRTDAAARARPTRESEQTSDPLRHRGRHSLRGSAGSGSGRGNHVQSYRGDGLRDIEGADFALSGRCSGIGIPDKERCGNVCAWRSADGRRQGAHGGRCWCFVPQPNLHCHISTFLASSRCPGAQDSSPACPSSAFHASRRAPPAPPGRWAAPAKPNTQRILLTSCPFHTAPAWLRSLGFAGSAQRRSSTYPQCREVRAGE
jgi:hypothetical protein